MSYWKWDAELDLGIPMIDAQHKHIVDFINYLHEAIQNHDEFLISHALIGLSDYTITHFAFEEKLLEISKYPLITAHKEVHTAFTKRIDSFRQQHEAGKDIARAMMMELKLWLTQHIKNEDRNYLPFVKNIIKTYRTTGVCDSV